MIIYFPATYSPILLSSCKNPPSVLFYFYMALIQYSFGGKHLDIKGTNQIGDLMISAPFIPFGNCHLGVYIASRWLWKEIEPSITGKAITITAYSMGASIALELTHKARKKGYYVTAILKAPYPVHIFPLDVVDSILIRVNNNDIVPLLFRPLYRFPKNTVRKEGEPRRLYKLLNPWHWGNAHGSYDG